MFENFIFHWSEGAYSTLLGCLATQAQPTWSQSLIQQQAGWLTAQNRILSRIYQEYLYLSYQEYIKWRKIAILSKIGEMNL